jgi:hypothetical protein
MRPGFSYSHYINIVFNKKVLLLQIDLGLISVANFIGCLINTRCKNIINHWNFYNIIRISSPKWRNYLKNRANFDVWSDGCPSGSYFAIFFRYSPQIVYFATVATLHGTTFKIISIVMNDNLHIHYTFNTWYIELTEDRYLVRPFTFCLATRLSRRNENLKGNTVIVMPANWVWSIYFTIIKGISRCKYVLVKL